MHKPALIGTLVMLGSALMPRPAFSQEKKEPAAPPKAQPTPDAKKPAGDKPAAPTQPPGMPPPGEMPPEMKAMMEAMMPGPPHQNLAKLAGDWTVKTKLVMDPATPPEETEATSKISMVLEGRFLHEDFTGTMHGMPFKSTHILGYNNGSKKYEGMWAYTMGTAIMNLVGSSTDGGKTIKCDAVFDNEMGIKETMNVTYTFADDDHFTVELGHGKMPDGSPGPTMNMAYTRKK